MSKFILSDKCTNRFPYQLSLTKDFSKYFPLGGTIDDFEAYARKEYSRMVSNQALINALNNISKEKRYGHDCIISAIGTIHGIPCFLTEGLFCWDDPSDQYQNIGIHIEGVGIGFAKGCDQDFVNHEKIHAAQRYYISQSIMPVKKGFFGITRNIDEVYLRLRQEVYAYWLGSPKRLIGNDIETLCVKLTGQTLQKLKSSYLLPEDSRLIVELVECFGMMDKTTHKSLSFKASVAIKLIQEDDLYNFYRWFTLELGRFSRST